MSGDEGGDGKRLCAGFGGVDVRLTSSVGSTLKDGSGERISASTDRTSGSGVSLIVGRVCMGIVPAGMLETSNAQLEDTPRKLTCFKSFE